MYGEVKRIQISNQNEVEKRFAFVNYSKPEDVIQFKKEFNGEIGEYKYVKFKQDFKSEEISKKQEVKRKEKDINYRK